MDTACGFALNLLIATGNASKGREMAELLVDTGLRLLTLEDFPNVPNDVEETGTTYAENAAIKARFAAQSTGVVSIADDAGFEVDALNGEPGLYSRRYLGEETTFADKMDYILHALRDVPDEMRGCRFRCAVAIAVPAGKTIICEAVCEGRVGVERRGAHGFGYDPIFLLPSIGKHMAELPAKEKHLISHRGIAMACARRELANLFNPTF